METMRIILIGYVLLSPFLWIYLQQSFFLETFDDDNGNKIIVRLHLITTAACLIFFLISFNPILFLEGFTKCS